MYGRDNWLWKIAEFVDDPRLVVRSGWFFGVGGEVGTGRKAAPRAIYEDTTDFVGFLRDVIRMRFEFLE